MRIAVLRETAAGERRVALVPEHVARLVKQGHEVRVERGRRGRGRASPTRPTPPPARRSPTRPARWRAPRWSSPSGVPSDALTPRRSRAARCWWRSSRPTSTRPSLARLAARGVSVLAMERVPRITRAQAMDALSSQATLAGYRAVLLGATALPRILPMMTTAAGTLAPAKVFVVGAGVAGLQAIATARRLGAVVSAFDVRPAVKEQVRVARRELRGGPGGRGRGRGRVREGARRAGAGARPRGAGRAREGHGPRHHHRPGPGPPGARLLTAAMVRSMRPGSVIVDLAAETGGNCELTRPGETVVEGGVQVIGAVNLPASVPLHASQLYGRNVLDAARAPRAGRAAGARPGGRDRRGRCWWSTRGKVRA